MVKSESPRRRLFLDQVFTGSRHVVDLADTDFGAVNGLRTALYREAARRSLQVKVQQAPDGRVIVQAYGGSLGTYAPDFSDVDTTRVTVTQDPTIGPNTPTSAPRTLPPATELPPIAPGDPLYTNPGQFWVGRTWEPAAEWVNPFGENLPNPLQCIWYPYNKLWELGDLSDLEARRQQGTLMPDELCQGFVPPGTAFSYPTMDWDEDKEEWVPVRKPWQQEEWWELACERHYCTCKRRLTNTFVDPDKYRPDHEDGCAYEKAPAGIDEKDKLRPMLDPRALRAQQMIDAAMVWVQERVLAERRRKAQGP